MKLIKCNHCGRPFYDNERKCPYCGSDASLSANRFVTKPVSDPKSHRLMEEVLSGNPVPRISNPAPRQVEECEPRPVHSAPVITPDTADTDELAAVDEGGTLETTPPTPEPQPDEAPNSARAEAMASIAASAVVSEGEGVENTVEEVETVPAPHKRRWWIWLLILVIILAAAAAVYLKWDFVHEKVASLFG